MPDLIDQRPTGPIGAADFAQRQPLVQQAVALSTAPDCEPTGDAAIRPANALFRAEDVEELMPLAPSVAAQEWLPGNTAVAEGESPATVREMTVDEVLTYALAHHPALRAQQHEVEVAQAKLITARLRRNPQLVVDTRTPLHESEPTALVTRVEFAVPSPRKRRLRTAVAEAGIQRARCVLRQETQRILQEAADAAVEVLYLQELLQLNAEISQLRARVVTTTSPALDPSQPELSLVNRVTAEVAAANAQLERFDTRAQLAVAQRRLALAIGLPPPTRPAVTGRITTDLGSLVPLQTVLTIARENRPDICAARVALNESQQQHALAHAEARPDLTIGPRYRDELGVDRDVLGARFETEVPIFDRNQGAICESAAQVRTNRALLSAAELSSLSDVAAVYAELVSIQENLEYFASHIAQLEDDTRELLGREAVQRGISDYQEARIRLALAELRVRRLERQYRYQQLLTRLEVFLSHPITQP